MLVYSYLLIVIGTIMIVMRLMHFRDLYRRQSLPLLLGALTPWVVDIIYRINPSAFLYLNPTPIVITLGVTILLWRMVQLQATDVIPVAHRIIMDSMGESVILLDSKDRIIDLNPSAQTIIGNDLSQALAQPIGKLWSDWPIVEKVIENRESSKEVFLGEKYNGRFFDIRFYSLTGVTSRLGSRLIVMRDITERRIMEDEIKKAEAAKKLVEYKDRFISTVTHELKTPISVIKGYVEYLCQSKLEMPISEMKVNLEVVKRNTDQLLKITDELLDIRQMQTGKMPLRRSELNFKEIVEECMKDVKPLIYRKKHQVSLDINSQVISILADRTKLRQVVLNIVTNAIKFTPEGGVIRISLRDEGDIVKFEVSDTGIGIKKGDLKRVFEPFTIIDKPTYVKGAGLGLSITKGIVQLHHGKITAESRGIGKGSTFRIILPKLKVAPSMR
jgi:signal transduction histidine kinase